MQDVLRAELVWVLLTGDSEDRFQWCGSGEERWTLVEAQLATDPHGFPTDAGIGSRLLAGSTTGALAVAVAQPTDVVKVRFQAQARAGAGRRYQSTVEAYKTIAREEGFRGLWKGVYQLFSLPRLPLSLLPGLT